jgi:protein-S-isoprenylcysteine O-methyltransferase Ste14
VREVRRRGERVRIASLVGFLLMVAGLLGLLATHALFTLSPVVIALQAAAAILMIWARLTFGARSFHATADPTEGGLVTSGPYRFIRHPIYTAVCLFAFAGVLAHVSLMGAALAFLCLAGALTRMFVEERILLRRYPEYAPYAAKTKRMVPFIF